MYKPESLMEIVEDIGKDKLVLPAMQRNFVWSEEKICRLFDSVMRGYPIGMFLFWEIDADKQEDYIFNSFIQNYEESRDKIYRGKPIKTKGKDVAAVLDGQQRMTSIYIGAKGSISSHIKGKSWDDKKSGFVKKYLCIDVLHKLNVDLDSDCYEFRFVQENILNSLQNEKEILLDDEGKKNEMIIKRYWYPVSKVFEDEFNPSDIQDYLEDNFSDSITKDERRSAKTILNILRNAVEKESVIKSHTCSKMGLTQVVEIFTRVNSGGEKLTSADLMLSIASGIDPDKDFQAMIKQTMERVAKLSSSDSGVKVDKELLLTAGFMFTDAKSVSLRKAENYSKDNIKPILNNWDCIEDALYYAIDYIKALGIDISKMTSKNVILPIAYYFYLNKLDDKYKKKSSKSAVKDRIYIRQWILRAMITGVFSDSIPGTLVSYRNIIKAQRVKKYFPLDSLLEGAVRRITITQEDVDDILNKWTKDDVRVYPLLAELCKRKGTEIYDIDHIWPQASFANKAIRAKMPKAKDDVIKEFQSRQNKLANLQLLVDCTNRTEKNGMLFEDWISKYPQSKDYYTNNLIPDDKGLYKYERFIDFTNARKVILEEAIKDAFPKSIDEINHRHGLD